MGCRRIVNRPSPSHVDLNEVPQWREPGSTGRRAAASVASEHLTASRTGEVLGATWDEFDLDQKVWTIPAVRMKAGHEHRLPQARRKPAAMSRISVSRPLG